MQEEIKWQVSNPELSKKLHELGFKGDHFFKWKRWRGKWVIHTGYIPEDTVQTYYPAYTVSELGIPLKWKSLMIFGLPEHFADFISKDITEANFRAKIIIYLIKTKQIKL